MLVKPGGIKTLICLINYLPVKALFRASVYLKGALRVLPLMYFKALLRVLPLMYFKALLRVLPLI